MGRTATSLIQVSMLISLKKGLSESVSFLCSAVLLLLTTISLESVRIFFQANKELRITKSATREDEKLDLISLDEYLKKNSVVVSPEDPENPGEGGGEGGGGVTPDPSV